MPGYAMLILPSANRVYADASVQLARAELATFSDGVLGGRLSPAAPAEIGGVTYVEFEAGSIGPGEASFLANVSALYALFEKAGDGLLRPVVLGALDRYDDDLITIQKYQGKTNEQFTKLLLNVTLMASAFAAQMSSRLAVLDPLCGRGTTLNQAVMYGYDAAGIDHDRKDFDAYCAFLKTWLRRKRVRHRTEYEAPVRRDNKVIGQRFQVSLAAGKDDYKAGLTQRLDVVCADTTRAAEFFRPESFHLLVTDAPYGVQHGSRTAASGLARRPQDLLVRAVPGWAGLLRPGGTLGIALNTLVAPRAEAAAILAGAGLEPVESAPYLEFRHRVDQAITRDIVVARKP
jgi:SAM-dependent methyltransferase